MSMTERSTTEIKTPNGHTVVVYDFITGREYRQIQDVFLKKMEISNLTREGASISGFSGSITSEAQDAAFKILLVSVDGEADKAKASEMLLDLPNEDFQAVAEKISEITEPKKKSETQ